MRESFLSKLIFLLLFFSIFIEAKAQMTAVRCNRATLESFPKQEAQPVLQYLDEARESADKFMRLLREEKFDEIYNLNKRTRIFVQDTPAVEMTLAEFEQTQGKITRFEFRDQDIIWYLNDYLIHLNGTVGTWYAVNTTKTKDKPVLMLVETRKIKSVKSDIVEDVFYRVPSPELLSGKKTPIQRNNCPSHNDVLNVEATD